MALLWLILKRYTILEDSFLLDFFLSVRYRDDVRTTLKFDWSYLKILMSGWYRKLISSCVSFARYQQCHTDIKGDVTPILLQYQNVHCVRVKAKPNKIVVRQRFIEFYSQARNRCCYCNFSFIKLLLYIKHGQTKGLQVWSNLLKFVINVTVIFGNIIPPSPTKNVKKTQVCRIC